MMSSDYLQLLYIFFFSAFLKFYFFNLCLSVLYSVLIFLDIALSKGDQVLHLLNLQLLSLVVVDSLTVQCHQFLSLSLAFLLSLIGLSGLALEHVALLIDLFLVLHEYRHLPLVEDIHLELAFTNLADEAFLRLLLSIGNGWLARERALLLGAVFAGLVTTECTSDVIST